MPAPNGLDHVSTTKSNGTRSIAPHPFHKLRACPELAEGAGSCKERKEGAPSVGTLHAEIVKGGATCRRSGSPAQPTKVQSSIANLLTRRNS